MPDNSVMKTAEEWYNVWKRIITKRIFENLAKDAKWDESPFEDIVRDIQRDALEAAAAHLDELANEIRTFEIRTAYWNAARAIRSLIPQNNEKGTEK